MLSGVVRPTLNDLVVIASQQENVTQIGLAKEGA